MARIRPPRASQPVALGPTPDRLPRRPRQLRAGQEKAGDGHLPTTTGRSSTWPPRDPAPPSAWIERPLTRTARTARVTLCSVDESPPQKRVWQARCPSPPVVRRSSAGRVASYFRRPASLKTDQCSRRFAEECQPVVVGRPPEWRRPRGVGQDALRRDRALHQVGSLAAQRRR